MNRWARPSPVCLTESGPDLSTHWLPGKEASKVFHVPGLAEALLLTPKYPRLSDFRLLTAVALITVKISHTRLSG